MTKKPVKTGGAEDEKSPRAVDVEDEEFRAAVVGWITEEVSTTGPQARRLGRFCFTVSTGTMAAGVGLIKLLSHSPGYCSVFAFVAMLVSAGVALWLAIPTNPDLQRIGSVTRVHNNQTDRTRTLATVWFGFWILEGVLLAVEAFDLAALVKAIAD